MNTDNLNKPDSMADDDKELLNILFNWHQHRESYYDDFKSEALTEAEWNKVRDNVDNHALEQLNAYTTNKIIEARIDELEKLDGNFGSVYSHGDGQDRTIQQRLMELKALNHRKERYDI